MHIECISYVLLVVRRKGHNHRINKAHAHVKVILLVCTPMLCIVVGTKISTQKRAYPRKPCRSSTYKARARIGESQKGPKKINLDWDTESGWVSIRYKVLRLVESLGEGWEIAN